MMTWIIIGVLVGGQIAGINGLTMWTSPENKGPVYILYGILMTVQAVAIAVILK